MCKESFFDADYFECGIESGKSAYQNYCWLPEFTIPMAMTLIDELGLSRDDSVLDYGCSKGYLVKAFRLLHRKAFGVDISTYAIQNVDSKVKQFCKKIDPNPVSFCTHDWPVNFDWVIAKDVFEHIPDKILLGILRKLPAKKLFMCVPLGDYKKGYRSPVNNLDKSHIICQDEYWWGDVLKLSNWSISKFTFRIDGIKDNYYATTPTAHGFFICERD